jgi:hypothetical protein
VAEALIQGGTPSANSLMAILFDLGRRGNLVIEETSTKHWYKQADFNVRLVHVGGLRAYERTLLEYLYQTANLDAGLTASMRKMGPELVNQWNRIAPGVEAELKMLGWTDEERSRTAQKWTYGAFAGFFVGMIAFIGSFFLMSLLGPWIVLIGGVLMALGAVWIVLAASLPKLSERGREEAARCQAARRYVAEVTQGRDPAVQADAFERYLPYAAAFGLATGWARFFQKRGIAQIPGWFQADAGNADGMVAFVSMIDTSYASASASGDGGGGAGGSAGGGSSSTG